MKGTTLVLLSLACLSGIMTQAAVTDAAETVVIAVAPQTLVLGFTQGGEVTVHAEIPLSRVDRTSLTLNDIPVKWTKSDARGELVAKFDEEEVEAIVSPPSATLILRGVTVDGEPFEGSDTVRVVH